MEARVLSHGRPQWCAVHSSVMRDGGNSRSFQANLVVAQSYSCGLQVSAKAKQSSTVRLSLSETNSGCILADSGSRSSLTWWSLSPLFWEVIIWCQCSRIFLLNGRIALPYRRQRLQWWPVPLMKGYSASRATPNKPQCSIWESTEEGVLSSLEGEQDTHYSLSSPS